jgi:predicted transcriptional regulator
MTIELPRAVEKELQTVAENQGRDVLAVVEDAVRQYLEGNSITDLDPAAVAATQIALAGELPDPSAWHDGDPA